MLAFNESRFSMLIAGALPHLEALRDEFEETINLGTLDGDRVLYLEIVESQQSMRLAARRGARDPLHATALGKALASLLSDDDVLSLLASAGMKVETMRTIATPAHYLEELTRVRERGFALDDGEQLRERSREAPLRLARAATSAGLRSAEIR